jgi:hypothetical protein
MLAFHGGYAADQSGVRVAARDEGRHILFRVEKGIAVQALGLRPSPRAPFEHVLRERLPDVRQACRRAYLGRSNSDRLTLIRVERHHFGHC